jgi:N6-L-threonylcarbamoyladenine synthase
MSKYGGKMIILGIETSCDDTAISLIDEKGKVLSNVLSSQEIFHRDFGGIVPEIASRKHSELIGYVITEALKIAGKSLEDIDLISVTKGPGLVGSLLVGVEAAKSLSFALNKPLIGINHLEGHIYSLFLDSSKLSRVKNPFPLIILIASGGHTELIIMEGHLKYRVIGKTRDDAAGEALDKFARFLGYGYPGGPIIEKLGTTGNPEFHKFPKLTFKGSPYEFSFSGLKTAGVYFLEKNPNITKNNLGDIAASFEKAVVDILVERTLRAARDYKVKGIGVVGGVSANKRLRDTLIKKSPVEVFLPEKIFSTDNAAMIALAGHIHFKRGDKDNLLLDIYSRLEIE